MNDSTSSVFSAQGSLSQFSPFDLLDRLGQLGFTGRLSLVSEDSPRRVVTLHLEHGEPILAVGSGIPRGLSEADEAHCSRQAFLESMCWEQGRFSIGEGEPGSVRGKHRGILGSTRELIEAANLRQETWELNLSRLPASVERVKVRRRADQWTTDDPVEATVVEATSSDPVSIPELSLRTQLDEHLVLRSVIDLAARSILELTAPVSDENLIVPDVEQGVLRLLELVSVGATRSRTLKMTVLSWDSATIFRAVEAIQGRSNEPPEAIDDSPRFQVISETIELRNRVQLEILAFREDAFEPDFCAPLVQDCHVFLLVSDVEAGHNADEAPLVDRINRVRSMFSGLSLAGRITVGASAETDPGCDVLLPELARYDSWRAAQKPGFLAALLRELVSRLE